MNSGTTNADKTTGAELAVTVAGILFMLALAVSLTRMGSPGFPTLGAPLIAVAPTVAAIIWKLIRDWWNRQKGTPTHWLSRETRAFLLVWLVAYVMGYLTPTALAWFSSADVQVTFAHSGRVRHNEVVDVTWRRLPDGRSPAVFVYWIDVRRYFPQLCNFGGSESGGNQCQIQIGGESASGLAFDIITATLDDTARKELEDYRKNPNAQGLFDLPATAVTIRAVRVIRE